MNLLVDPILLLPPNKHSNEETVTNYFEQLMQWSDLIRSNEHDFFISESYIQPMIDMGCFPAFALFKDLCDSLDLHHIDAKTAYRACSRLIENTPYFEERANLKNIVQVYEDSVSTNPDVISRLPPSICNAFRETLGYVVYAYEQLKAPITETLFLVTSSIDNHTYIDINAKLETQTGELISESELPFISSPQNLMNTIGIINFWRDHDKAIKWAIEELIKCRRLKNDYTVYPHLFSRDFDQSIEDYGLDKIDHLYYIFQNVASLITGNIAPREDRRNHALKDVSSRCVDNLGQIWNPWRIHVTKGKPTIRLHYWRRDNRFIISRAVVHEDYYIGPVPDNCDL